MPRTEIVGQRQIGIICPDQDLNRVKKIATTYMTTCVGVVLRDLEMGIDFLTHLDYIQLLPSAFELALPTLERLGVKSLDMRTVNAVPSPETQAKLPKDLLARTLALRLRTLDEFADRLVSLGLSPDGDWCDLGTAYGVVLETGQDTRIGPFGYSYFGLSSNQRAAIEDHRNEFKRLIHGERPSAGEWKMPVTASYKPVLWITGR